MAILGCWGGACWSIVGMQGEGSPTGVVWGRDSEQGIDVHPEACELLSGPKMDPQWRLSSGVLAGTSLCNVSKLKGSFVWRGINTIQSFLDPLQMLGLPADDL